ncbi:lysophospholipid acyltransferase family protein [Yoonia sp.]|uniref:lysophospholipid acyltransferase family protein n=1 Tax=Yoonia sp. TaxID=2212373 RepID=UPI0035C7998F
MGALSQYCRGAWACALWLAATPLMNARIIWQAETRDEARGFMQAHIKKFLRRCRVDVVVDGIKPDITTGCVVCYNETSFIDVNAFCLAMWPYIDRGAAADLYAYFPGGRAAFTKVGLEMVPRGNRAGVDRLLAKMVAAIKTGERVAWGGEGRIVGVDGIGRFKIGSSLIAIRAQAPIVPVAFFGGHRIMPFPSVRVKPGTVFVRFGEPVPTAGLLDEDARDLADRLQAIMSQMYEDLRAESEAPRA